MSIDFDELLCDHMQHVVGYDTEELSPKHEQAQWFTKQELAFNNLCEELYQKYNLYHENIITVDDFNQHLYDICRSYQTIIYKDFSTRLIGYIFTILSLGLALFSSSFCDIFFTNSSISEGIEHIILHFQIKPKDNPFVVDEIKSINTQYLPHRSTILTHRNLIDCAKKLGYSPNEGGICYGFSMRWIEACFLGAQDTFYKRLKKIYKLNKLLSSGCSLDKIQHSTIWKNKLLNIRAFFESLMLYQSPHHFKAVFNQELGQNDISDVSKLAASDDMMQLGGLQQTAPFKYGSFDSHELMHFLQEIENLVDEQNYQDLLCIRLNLYSAAGGHSVCLMYHPPSKDWQFMDVNQMNSAKTHFKLSHLNDAISFDNHETYNAQLVLPHQHHAQDLLNKITRLSKLNLKKSDGVVSKPLETLLFVAVKFNDSDILKTLLTQIENPNITKAHGITPLIEAVIKNQNDLVKILLEDKRINPNQAMDTNTTPLMLSIQNQNTDIVSAILAHEQTDPNLVMNSGFSALIMAVAMNSIEIAQKLASDSRTNLDILSPNGVSAIDIASLNGYSLI